MYLLSERDPYIAFQEAGRSFPLSCLRYSQVKIQVALHSKLLFALILSCLGRQS